MHEHTPLTTDLHLFSGVRHGLQTGFQKAKPILGLGGKKQPTYPSAWHAGGSAEAQLQSPAPRRARGHQGKLSTSGRAVLCCLPNTAKWEKENPPNLVATSQEKPNRCITVNTQRALGPPNERDTQYTSCYLGTNAFYVKISTGVNQGKKSESPASLLTQPLCLQSA